MRFVVLLALLALLLIDVAVASEDPEDNYLGIVRRHQWSGPVSEKIINNAIGSPVIPETCKVAVYREFSSRQIERLFAESLHDYFSTDEAAEYVAFLRTPVGMKLAVRDLDSTLTPEEEHTFESFRLSPASASFIRFSDEGVPRLIATLEDRIKAFTRQCYMQHYRAILAK